MSTLSEPVVVSWSGGKDSCLALHEVLLGRYRVEALLTTITEGYERISMHGVRRELLRGQAASLGLPVREVAIPPDASNETYEARMVEALREFRARGVERVVFGDLFLEDIRRYREDLLGRAGMSALFPVWGRDTRRFAEDFIRLGYEAVVVCVDPGRLDASFAGRTFDESFLKDLPSGVDPCGERGEFHTFVFGGPTFEETVEVEIGETVLRDGFLFADLLPKQNART